MGPETTRRDALVQAAVVLCAVGVYEAARLELRPDWPLALDHARRIEHLEHAAGVAWEVPLQRVVLGTPGLPVALDAFYLAHFVVTGLFFVWLYGRDRPAFRLFRNAFLAATGLALVTAWRFPTAPPRVAEPGVVDTLHRLGIDIGSPGSAALTDPVAAVPSLHVGWAIGVAVGLVAYARPAIVRVLALLYPTVAVLTVLATGNHFVFDAAAGAATMAAGFGIALVPVAPAVVRLPLRRGVEQPGSSPGS